MMAVDVVIVGLGAMGSAALYQLAKQGARVLGIDQFDPPHSMGSTHGETRITRLAVGEGEAYMPLVRRSHEIWQELEEGAGVKLLHQGGGYIINPTSGGAGFHGPGDFALKTAKLAAAYGIEHELLDAETLQARMPQLQIRPDDHACYEPSGGVVSPELAVATQLRLARALGADTRVNEKVLAVTSGPAGVTVTTDQGRYDADKVIVSAGGWLADLLPEPMQPSFQVYRQVFYWFEAERLDDFSLARFPWLLWIGTELADYYSVFPYVDGLTPAVKMVTEQYVESEHPDMLSRVATAAEIAHMREYFVARRLNGVTGRCLKSQVCLYTMTPDHDFIVDWHPEQENILIASPCSGHGFKHSAAIGEAIAQMVTGVTTDIDMSFFQLSRIGL